MPSAPIDLRPTKQGPKRHGTSRYDALTEERARLRAQREAVLAAQEAEAAEEAAFADDGATGKRKKSGKNATDNQAVVEPRERVVDDDAYAPASGPATATEQSVTWESIRAHRARLTIDEIAADNRAAPAPRGPDGKREYTEAEVADLNAIERKAREAKAAADWSNNCARTSRMYDQSEDHYCARVSSKPGTKR